MGIVTFVTQTLVALMSIGLAYVITPYTTLTKPLLKAII